MKFARDRWYSSEGQRRLQQRARSESMGTRRIISLSLLLFMILVVMQQLRDPQKYEPAFRAIGLTQPSHPIASAESSSAFPRLTTADSGSGSTDASNPMDASNSSLEEAAITTWQSLSLTPESSNVDLYMQMWLRLMESASPAVLSELAQSEFSAAATSRATLAEPAEPTVKTSDAVLEWLDLAQARVEQWQVEYQSLAEAKSSGVLSKNTDLELGTNFVRQWLAWASLQRHGITIASSALDPDPRRGLRLALDRQLLDAMRDASPWRPQERPGLARTMQRARAMAEWQGSDRALWQYVNQTAPIVEAASLMKQTQEYRGEPVRFRGQVVTQAEPAVQEIEGWGRFDYEVVWIRPDDTSQQPICVYTLSKPRGGWPIIKASNSSQPAASGAIDVADSPIVEFSGILLKRIAYPSQRGIDVAPVLIAFDVTESPDVQIDRSMIPRVTSPRIRSHRWVEPGEQATNLRLLEDIFGSYFESLSEPSIQSTLTSPTIAKDIASEAFQLELGQILYQLPRVSKPLSAAIATGQKIGPAQLATFQGWVRAVETIQLAETNVSPGEPMKIFRLEIDSNEAEADGKIRHFAFVNQVPTLWKSIEAISQPIMISGLFLQSRTDDGSIKCWFADHVDWSWPWLGESLDSDQAGYVPGDTARTPQTSKSNERWVPKIPDDWQLLGALGFDLSRIDMLGKLRGKSLTAEESQAFYSLIDCGDRISKSGMLPMTSSLSAIDCLREKDPPYLHRILAKVNIIRATRILVDGDDDQSALDGQAYYELDGLADIGDISIRLKAAHGQEDVYFQGEFPITLISKRLPPWLGLPENASLASSTEPQASLTDDVREIAATWYPRTTVEVEGIFYRLWSFNTAQTSAIQHSNSTHSNATVEQDRLRQIGPLVMVTNWKRPLASELPPPNRSIVREIGTAVGFSAIGIYLLYRLNQSSKRRKA